MRFAVLHDGAPLEHWQLRCLQQLVALPDVRAELQIAAQQNLPLLPGAFAKLPSVALSGLNGPQAAADEANPVVGQIRACDLDFILCFVDGSCPETLLDVPRYGVWQFEFGDWARYRGGPPGFWEVYDGEYVSGALLTRVLHSRGSVTVLREGYFRTDLLSYAGNRANMVARVAGWPAQVCVDVRNGVTSRFSDAPMSGTIHLRTAPTRWQLFVCSLRIAARMFAVAWRSLFRHDQWNVGLVDQPIAAFLHAASRATVQWLPAAKRAELHADPFGVLRDGHLTILCEHFSYRDNRGTIVAIESMSMRSGVRVAIGPLPAVHMSYPFVFEADNRVLCIPETSAAQEVALYEAESFPERWAKVATLVTGAAIVDATVFRHGEHWWLAGSEVAAFGANCELHLWYAQSITGPWRAHPGNPVKVDIRSARPAGTPFVKDGVLYRPAQDCARTYGGRVIINRVLTLTPVAFREEALVAVGPDRAGPYPSGLHTLSQVGNATLIDGKRVLFIPAEFRRVLFKKFSSVLKRASVVP